MKKVGATHEQIIGWALATTRWPCSENEQVATVFRMYREGGHTAEHRSGPERGIVMAGVIVQGLFAHGFEILAHLSVSGILPWKTGVKNAMLRTGRSGWRYPIQ